MAINFPNSPSDGATHTAAGQTFTYDGTAGVWNPQEGTPVSTGTSAPSSPSPGDLWFDTSSGTLYFYYADGSSNQWVGVSGPAGPTGATGATGATGPAGPTGSINILTDVDTATAAPSTGQLLQWNGTNWVPHTHTSDITEVDQWRLTANITTTTDITTNLERVDDASFAKIGTGMSHSSGVFSFPSTGLYEIITQATFYAQTDDGYMSLLTYISTDGGVNWDITADAISLYTGKWGRMTVGPGINFVNVTNTTNVKVKFKCNSLTTNNYLEGNTDITRTSFTFKRLGDNQ